MYIKMDEYSFTFCHTVILTYLKMSNVAEFSWSSWGPQPSQKRERNLRRRCSIRKLQLVVVPVRNGYTATVKKCTKKCDEHAKLILMAFSLKSPSP